MAKLKRKEDTRTLMMELKQEVHDLPTDELAHRLDITWEAAKKIKGLIREAMPPEYLAVEGK
ncbi:MAG: hypothetical protein HYT79_02710 [Elusimicrobia bacterium]|nr:hypothetical protein [Elusimicrobiota bacterium]